MARIISFINLKGKVGKSTTTVAVGEILAQVYGEKVLIVDLDPQTNATVMLIDQEEWRIINKNNKTIHQMFLDELENTSVFDIIDSIKQNVSNIGGGIQGLDLLPSSIDLIDISDDIAIANREKMIIDKLKKSLEQIDYSGEKLLDKYTYVLIDCPPNLNTITMCGVYASQYYVVPVLADRLSIYGLNQVIKKIETKSREIKRVDKDYNIKPLGVFINRYRKVNPYNKIKISLEINSNLGKIPKLFNTIINNKSNFALVSDFSESKSTIRGKYGEDFKEFKNLVDEIIERCDEFEKD